ncbi:hypothetical protein WDW89_02590 [Deltaproteobacteria bacterium TL4]
MSDISLFLSKSLNTVSYGTGKTVIFFLAWILFLWLYGTPCFAQSGAQISYKDITTQNSSQSKNALELRTKIYESIRSYKEIVDVVVVMNSVYGVTINTQKSDFLEGAKVIVGKNSEELSTHKTVTLIVSNSVDRNLSEIKNKIINQKIEWDEQNDRLEQLLLVDPLRMQQLNSGEPQKKLSAHAGTLFKYLNYLREAKAKLATEDSKAAETALKNALELSSELPNELQTFGLTTLLPQNPQMVGVFAPTPLEWILIALLSLLIIVVLLGMFLLKSTSSQSKDQSSMKVTLETDQENHPLMGAINQIAQIGAKIANLIEKQEEVTQELALASADSEGETTPKPFSYLRQLSSQELRELLEACTVEELGIVFSHVKTDLATKLLGKQDRYQLTAESLKEMSQNLPSAVLNALDKIKEIPFENRDDFTFVVNYHLQGIDYEAYKKIIFESASQPILPKEKILTAWVDMSEKNYDSTRVQALSEALEGKVRAMRQGENVDGMQRVLDLLVQTQTKVFKGILETAERLSADKSVVNVSSFIDKIGQRSVYLEDIPHIEDTIVKQVLFSTKLEVERNFQDFNIVTFLLGQNEEVINKILVCGEYIDHQTIKDKIRLEEEKYSSQENNESLKNSLYYKSIMMKKLLQMVEYGVINLEKISLKRGK